MLESSKCKREKKKKMKSVRKYMFEEEAGVELSNVKWQGKAP